MRFLSRVPVLVWFLVPTLVLVIGAVWFLGTMGTGSKKEDSGKPESVSTPVLGTVDYEVVGRNHITEGTSGTGYTTNPPISGPHWPSPANNGIYEVELPDEKVIHNLEHGYIWISYKPDVGDEVKKKLYEIVQGDDWKIVLMPRSKNDSKIALAAWGRLLKMDEPDYDKIREFIKTYRNRGPEKTPN